MPKYTETQSRKVISSYGGVESIIETPLGALKIEPFNLWPFFKAICEGKLDPQKFIIEDNRLLRRLQSLHGFPKLENFLAIPTDQANPRNKSVPDHANKSISATYFPTWFYCNNCKGFNNLKDWWALWKKVVQKHGEKAEKEKFIPPKCPYCYDKAKTSNSKEGKRRRFYYELEQVRFVMTTPSGDIRDIPWERWNKVKKDNSEPENSEEKEHGLSFDWVNLCCENQELQYIKSTKFSDLTGIRISCKKCNSNNTLSGFFGMRIGNKNGAFKPVLRTSNSCYYPVMISSIYLPVGKEISPEDERRILKWSEKGKDIEFIWEALDEKYTKKSIDGFISGEVSEEFEAENEYRLKEYRFLLDEKSNNTNLIYDSVNFNLLSIFGLGLLIAIKRLKVTTVQVAYTRQEPLNNDQFLSGEKIKNKIEAKYTSEWGNQTTYLPAIESFGEGIFLNLDTEKIDHWLTDVFMNERFRVRMAHLLQNSQSSDLKSIQQKFQSENHLARFVLIHTLSHILIKELEFLCGYPSTSLSERLFINQDQMHGVLIYTVAGTEGSYGGLASQADDQKFARILKSALYRATDCASDPICYNTEDGQGVGGLNLSACYSCCLIPENACEEFNSFLDRSLLIDREYGYFRSVL
ncbi:DUF1998 domain-containing protein [Haliscomenobacter hydrossis]|uniref:MrfA-like Zn-binding domain-containing protein n=1 Tax=Haliscomenobacter hydrossis (strain ATCC 27775 / DSM 1100 / LMG 10767 / O) TaxID=760192 RepID=F4L860_HALH1|nr:DUF1998 domain-containing protein [Haliscomenobacter hydrossis]AEE54568.1 Protein of unknown function DUF1998 [Haliscomenobacter hydrossis DSM 1100]